MFQGQLNNIERWFCNVANFVKLENPAFDDRRGNNAFTIQEADGRTEFTATNTSNVLIATRRFNIYVQYIDLSANFLGAFLHELGCTGQILISTNDDSVQVFKELNKVELKDSKVQFMKIEVELKEFIRPNNCSIC